MDVQLDTLRYAMLDLLRAPPPGAEEVRGHACMHARMQVYRTA